jgi:hypothetical protein
MTHFIVIIVFENVKLIFFLKRCPKLNLMRWRKTRINNNQDWKTEVSTLFSTSTMA